MKVLVLDSNPAAGDTLARDLRSALGRQTLCASSTGDAFIRLNAERDSIRVIVFFIEEGPEAGLGFIQQVQAFCSLLMIRCPRFVTLTPGNLSGGYLSKFRTTGAECVVYGFLEQLQIVVRRMIFEEICEKGRPTIAVDRTSYPATLWLLGPTAREMISVGPRLIPLINCFAINFGTELSTADLAEAADITLGSVRVYLDRLRQRFDEAAKMVGVNVAGRDVFCTFRKDGGFVHVLRARVLFI